MLAACDMKRTGGGRKNHGESLALPREVHNRQLAVALGFLLHLAGKIPFPTIKSSCCSSSLAVESRARPFLGGEGRRGEGVEGGEEG